MLAKIKALVCFHKYVSNPLLVGNNAKWQISKRVLQENKARQIFQKTNISYP